DAAVRRFAVAHALAPVVRMIFEVVVLIYGRRVRDARDGDEFRLRFPCMQIEHDIRSPRALGFRDEPPLRATLAARRVQGSVRSADDCVIAVATAESGR